MNGRGFLASILLLLALLAPVYSVCQYSEDVVVSEWTEIHPISLKTNQTLKPLIYKFAYPSWNLPLEIFNPNYERVDVNLRLTVQVWDSSRNSDCGGYLFHHVVNQTTTISGNGLVQVSLPPGGMYHKDSCYVMGYKALESETWISNEEVVVKAVTLQNKSVKCLHCAGIECLNDGELCTAAYQCGGKNCIAGLCSNSTSCPDNDCRCSERNLGIQCGNSKCVPIGDTKIGDKPSCWLKEQCETGYLNSTTSLCDYSPEQKERIARAAAKEAADRAQQERQAADAVAKEAADRAQQERQAAETSARFWAILLMIAIGFVGLFAFLYLQERRKYLETKKELTVEEIKKVSREIQLLDKKIKNSKALSSDIDNLLSKKIKLEKENKTLQIDMTKEKENLTIVSSQIEQERKKLGNISSEVEDKKKDVESVSAELSAKKLEYQKITANLPRKKALSEEIKLLEKKRASAKSKLNSKNKQLSEANRSLSDLSEKEASLLSSVSSLETKKAERSNELTEISKELVTKKQETVKLGDLNTLLTQKENACKSLERPVEHYIPEINEHMKVICNSTDGYLYKYKGQDKGKPYKFSDLIHWYVWEKYKGPRDRKKEIHHKDFNKWNNNPTNLEQVSREEHKKRHINRNKGNFI